jgi:hypothetical protein
MKAYAVKDSDNERSFSDNCLLFICLFSAFTVRYTVLTSLIFLSESMGAQKKKRGSEIRQLFPVHQGVTTSSSRECASRVTDARTNVEK